MPSTDNTDPFAYNNPDNPFPFYSTVSLSANNVYSPGIETLYLSDINFNTRYIVYTNYPTSQNALVYDPSDVLGFGYSNTWIFYNITLTSEIARLPTSVLALPSKSVGSAQGWIGTNVNDLYIKPDITQLTDWERRRRRLLEII